MLRTEFRLKKSVSLVTVYLAFVALAFRGIAFGQTDTWKGGNGNWSNGSLWSAGVPGSTSNVQIDGGNAAASVVSLDISDTINNLTIDSDDKLSFNNGTALTVSGGTISNAGNITLNGGNAVNSDLILGANTTLSGGGTVTLTSSGGNAILQGNGFTLTNTNNTIQGWGTIGNGSLALSNGGTVDANQSGQTLFLNGTGGITNTNLLEATNGGILQIDNTVNNATGSITANGGTVDFVSADIEGGTLNNKNGGIFQTPIGDSTTLDGSTHGALTLSKGSTYAGQFGSTTNVLGTINNNGNFQFNGGNAVNAVLNLNGNATLQGGGTVTLSSAGGTAIIQANGFTLTNTNNTIQGYGTIGNGSLILVNGTGGTIYANQLSAQLLINATGKITNNGTFKVASGTTLHLTNGAFTNFSGTTLTGGTYNTAGTLEIDELGSSGGEIVTNAANIILSGPSSIFVDSAGKDALSAFNTNAAKGSFTINSGRNFTTAGNFTNSGILTVGSTNSKFDVHGSLTNFSGTTLTGGTYNLTGTLQFNGANIVTNAANITLTGASSQIINQSSGNGLANFATNAIGGSFTINGGRNFTTIGNFSNAGTLNIGSGTNFTVGGPGVFAQTGGKTTDDGTLTDSGGLTLSGGSLFGKGTVSGAVNDSGGIITPGDSSTITGVLTDKGAYTQGSSGTLDISIAGLTAGTQFDQLNITSTASLNGTLNVSLIKGFVPTIGQAFKIMNFTSETGQFLHCTCAINSNEHFQITYQGTDVLLTVVAGPGGNFTPTGMFSQSLLSTDRGRGLIFGARSPWNEQRFGSAIRFDSPAIPSPGDRFRQLSLTPASVRQLTAQLPVRPAFNKIYSSGLPTPSRSYFARNNLLTPSLDLRRFSPSMESTMRRFSNGRGGFQALATRAQLRMTADQNYRAFYRRGLGADLINPALRGSARLPFGGSRSNSPLRERTVVGGLSWGLSSLLAKPKFGLAVQ